MMDLRFTARGRPGWEEWKLGDAILACSVLAVFDSVRLHVDNINTQGNQLIKQLSEEVFSNRYDFEMVEGPGGTIIHPDQFFLEKNLEVVTCNIDLYSRYLGGRCEYQNHGLVNDLYVTTQNVSKNARTVPMDKVYEHTKEYKCVDLNNTKETMSLRDTFSVVADAQYHVGAASGICWVAMSTKTPTICLMPSSFRKGGWDFALECMYRSSYMRILDI
jgi:hypothetical protein